jgi:hypothetical protein
MSHRTVEVSSFEEFLADAAAEYRPAEEAEREERLSRFPHSVMLKVSFAELDFANRWCWKKFGPCDGECRDRDSEYRACDRAEPHSHAGKWMWCFLGKTGYNFGFCEWCFAETEDRDLFVANVDKINWGEHYPISQY